MRTQFRVRHVGIQHLARLLDVLRSLHQTRRPFSHGMHSMEKHGTRSWREVAQMAADAEHGHRLKGRLAWYRGRTGDVQ